MSEVRRAAWTAATRASGVTADARPALAPVAVHELCRLVGSKVWVAARMAIRWPLRVTRYGAKAWAALAPMPITGNFAASAAAMACCRPGTPQSSPCVLASVTSERFADWNALSADGGAYHTYCLDWGSGQVPLVNAESKLAMATWEPWTRVDTPASAVVGSLCNLEARTPSKWTSPPKAIVTGSPLPCQAGDRGLCGALVEVVVVVDLLFDPPLMATRMTMTSTRTAAPTAT